MRVVAAVVALVACVHAGIWAIGRQQIAAPDIDFSLSSVSFAPFEPRSRPDEGQRTTERQIRADLKVLAPYTRSVRTYSATGGLELVPAIADEFGLKTTVGAWIDKDDKRNERELRNVIDIAKRRSSINGIVVGNETLFRGDKSVEELTQLIQRVKREVSVPVTTGEIWHVWLENPQLASAVDFIAAHILPYWEGFSEKAAVDQSILIYDKLRRAFPGKRIVIAEFGWPSAGYNLKNANPGKLEQAVVLRDFIARAEALGMDYNIVEAIDQPWKFFEGSVGPYWGMFDAKRQLKFNLTGPVADASHWKVAAVALLIGFLLSLPVLALSAATFWQTALLATGAHAVGAWLATVFDYWNAHYFTAGALFAFALGITLLIPLILIGLSRIHDIAAIAFGIRPRRIIQGALAAPDGYAPKVSIHIPAYREPPEMLKLTLDAVAALNYPNFECVVVINNTPEPEYWAPIEAHCTVLGDRFKFINALEISGYKAGALQLALAHTAEDAEIIGVLDADYVVHPDWLKDLAPAFADVKVGLVQAPQDHRDGELSVMHFLMNGEYAGFFDIGMVQRNEANAIVVHGTMCLIRRSALAAAGNWSTDTICEDTDLGLTIIEQGWQAHYTNRRYGWGLLPDTFDAFKRQRHRWAYGGFQIVKKHWRRFLPGASLLTRNQKHEFAMGWLNWLGAETLGVVVAILNLLWVPIIAFAGIAVPDKILTLPIIAAFVISVAHFSALYRLRVPIPIYQTIGAAFAAMALQWTVARAIGDGMIKDHLPFARTAKGGGARKAALEYQAFWETLIGGLLVLGAFIVVVTNRNEIREINIFALVLLIQSIPFLSAAWFASLEGSRLNKFAFWKGIETRLAYMRLAPRRVVKVPSVSVANVAVAANVVVANVATENSVETVQ